MAVDAAAVRIKSRMGISIDGYVATPDGTPALIKAPGFVPGQSHGCSAAAP